MSRASGTRRGSAVRMPGTSFHSTTRRAPSARARSVAVRSEPPRPSVVTLPSGRPADEAGHDRRSCRRVEQRPQHAASRQRVSSRRDWARRRRAGRRWRRSPCASTYAARRRARVERRGQDRRRHALAARHEHVARARREVAEHADRAAQLAVLARRRVDRREQRVVAPGPAGRSARATSRCRRRNTAAARRRRRRSSRDVAAARAVEQQVGDAGRAPTRR